MEYTLTHARVQVHAAALLIRCLQLTNYSARCPARMLLAVLFVGAAHLTSVFAAAKRLLAVASPETIRKALRAALPGEDELERRLNCGLVADVPRSLRQRRQRLAVDLTLIPYHGQPLHHENEVYRGEPKHGTSHFHAYATCYVVYQGRRFTLALCRVRLGDSLARIVRWLLLQAGQAGVRSELVLLDRGFCSVEVIRYLQAARRPFLMPLVARGRSADHPQGPSASQVFFTRRQSGWDRYTMTAEDGRRATFEVCIACDNWRGRRGRRGRRTLVFAFWGLRPSNPDWVRETYRLRFGIETSYRQMNQARIQTCSKDPQVRLLFVGLALILRNVWVYLHYAILSTPRRGGRVINLELLPLKEMLLWLLRVAERDWGEVNTVETERHVETAFTTE